MENCDWQNTNDAKCNVSCLTNRDEKALNFGIIMHIIDLLIWHSPKMRIFCCWYDQFMQSCPHQPLDSNCIHSKKSKTQENWNKAHAIKWSVSKTMNKICNSLPIQCTSKSRHSPFHFSLLQLTASSPNTHSPFISPFNPRKFHTLFHLTKAWTWKPRRMVVSLVIKAFTEHMEKNGQKTIAMKSVFCCLLICYCTRVP